MYLITSVEFQLNKSLNSKIREQNLCYRPSGMSHPQCRLQTTYSTTKQFVYLLLSFLWVYHHLSTILVHFAAY